MEEFLMMTLYGIPAIRHLALIDLYLFMNFHLNQTYFLWTDVRVADQLYSNLI